MNAPAVELKRTPLNSAHRRLSGRMVEFGGWDMPVQYAAGTMTEHLRTRTHAGLFDVSHMGEIDVRGDGQFLRLEQIPGYAERHGVRPGLTGLTQVYAPRDISRASKFRLDRLYLKRAGFCLDLKLIVLSFWITGRGEWEARGRKV